MKNLLCLIIIAVVTSLSAMNNGVGIPRKIFRQTETENKFEKALDEEWKKTWTEDAGTLEKSKESEIPTAVVEPLKSWSDTAIEPKERIDALLSGKVLGAAEYKELYATIENLLLNSDKIIAEAKAHAEKKYEEARETMDEAWADLCRTHGAPEQVNYDAARKKWEEAHKNRLSLYGENDPVKIEMQKLAPAVSSEIYNEMSRELDQNNPVEKEASKNLIKVLGKEGIPIDEVRFIDAKTLMDHMKLPNDNLKKKLVGLLDTTQNETQKLAEIHKLIDTSIMWKSMFGMGFFSTDPLLKDTIGKDLHEMATASQTYRNLILTLIAWSEASPKICDAIADGFEPCFSRNIIFTQDQRLNASSTYNQISLCYKKHTLHSSLFGQPPDTPVDGLYWQQWPKGCMLFHEIGHTVSSNIADADGKLGLDDAFSIKVASKLADIVVNPDVLEKQIALATQVAQEHPELHGFFVDFYNQEFRTSCRSIDEVIAHQRTVSESIEALTKFLFGTSMEILQIAGLHCARHLERNVLYINKLSDFALCAEMGWPIRYDHSGKTTELPGAEVSEEYRKIKQFSDRLEACGQLVICHGMNRPLHQWLFRVFGYDMADYEKRLKEKLATH
ncbi:hypothetical protein FACS189449_01980 [Alphaproteobacteria bacterium]|nr:hypothetical protein FACS189449_01980 [Alphaproteobacteria bacterium]